MDAWGPRLQLPVVARALRILVSGGRYHVTSRSNRRQPLFLDDADRRGFLALVAELPDRFAVEIHAFVLMDDHYHLLLRTRDANLSHAIRWLNVTYSIRFNLAHDFTGHVFQGRFKAVIIQGERGVVEVARHMHLNPVRVLGRPVGGPARQIEVLREYSWSSWRACSGSEPEPPWLSTATLATGCGGRSPAQRRVALRKYTEAPIRQGEFESPWKRLLGGLILGDEAFALRLLKGRPLDTDEQTEARRLRRIGRADWASIQSEAGKLRGRPWEELLVTHGEWGRDGAMFFAVRYGGYRLVEVVRGIPGLKYQAAAQAVKRFQAALEKDRKRERFVAELRRKLAPG